MLDDEGRIVSDDLDMHAAALRDWACAPPINMEIGRSLGFILLGQLQLALRHPANTGPTAEAAEQFARHLQSVLGMPPQLAAIAEQGWDPGYDA